MTDRWLTYEQAGERLGISSEAARQRARRLRWPQRRSVPSGKTLIQIPDDAAPKAVKQETAAVEEWKAALLQATQTFEEAKAAAWRAYRAACDAAHEQMMKAIGR